MHCHILRVRAIPTLESTDSMILSYRVHTRLALTDYWILDKYLVSAVLFTYELLLVQCNEQRHIYFGTFEL